MKQNEWSNCEDTYLIVSLERQIPLQDISKSLERTQGSIRARLQRLGYTKSSPDILVDLLKKIRTPVPEMVGPYHAGYRETLGISVRSSWENNLAHWFNYMGYRWEYEPQRFYFDIKRGTRSYLPDFKLVDLDIWVEVKGRFKPTDRTRMKRFLKKYPEEAKKLRGIPKNAKVEAAKTFAELEIPIFVYYDDIVKEYSDKIEGWEFW